MNGQQTRLENRDISLFSDMYNSTIDVKCFIIDLVKKGARGVLI